MDLDRYLATHEPTWLRLEDLTARARGRVERLDPAEVDELIRLYQRVSAHLSFVRTHLADPALVHRLTRLVGEASAVVYGTRTRDVRAIGRMFTQTFPAALWHARAMIGVAALLFVVPMVVVGSWLANSDRALEVAAPTAVREAVFLEGFESYYSEKPAAQFASEVFINNIQVAILSFALGILLCAGTAAVLMFNGVNVGLALGLFAATGHQGRFWGLILPHGLLELTAVFVAGAAGLALGWAIISPGDVSRSDALVAAGRRAVVLIFGAVAMLALSGVIEGFVTGSALSTLERVGIGVAAEVAFLAYAVVLGRQAVAAGVIGEIGQ